MYTYIIMHVMYNKQRPCPKIQPVVIYIYILYIIYIYICGAIHVFNMNYELHDFE